MHDEERKNVKMSQNWFLHEEGNLPLLLLLELVRHDFLFFESEFRLGWTPGRPAARLPRLPSPAKIFAKMSDSAPHEADPMDESENVSMIRGTDSFSLH